jgi:hypothetical protein
MRIFNFFLCLVFLLFATCAAIAGSKVERQGYVTALNPPSGFKLGRYEVRVDEHTKIYELSSDSKEFSPFSFSVVPPCTYISVKGIEDTQTHSLLAKTIDLLSDKSQCKVSGTGIEDKAPSLKKEGAGWSGTAYVDGYEITVDAKTKVALSGVSDANQFNPQLRVEYAAERQQDGNLHATRLSFAQNKDIAEQQKYRDANDFKIDLPDYDKNIPGKVHFFLWSARILPDRKLQDTVSALGEKLIPEWQKQLSDSDPAKIHFRFFVIEKTRNFKTTVSNDAGTVLIPVNVLMRLKNEAQLMSLLSADISSAIMAKGYSSRSHKYTERAIDIGLDAVPFGASFPGQLINDGAFSAKYWQPLLERDYRVGMQYVLAAGYDPREMPLAIQRLISTHPDDASPKHFSTVPAYLDAQLGFRYGNIDFSSLRTGETEYAALLNMVRAADPKSTVEGKTRLSDNE